MLFVIFLLLLHFGWRAGVFDHFVAAASATNSEDRNAERKQGGEKQSRHYYCSMDARNECEKLVRELILLRISP
ncbi:hypothetical protein-signal peptide and transmembrane prediction [Rhodopirellula baltica SH 1]|uniref:Uncharacterized protein n=1 Tax=Rhodopirellula baltica (strain DSM 10527 / NCIMB 13988 / SH1) TaxID=243090 RepID=Q7UZF1_RHOBA|nr:hypothetical protein-signal peptide and transmembrane prediction [Rhodopirellula baltica SH 1]